MDNIFCKHYLLPNKSLLKYSDFSDFFTNIKNIHYYKNNHIIINIKDSIHYKILTKEISFNLYNKYITLTGQKEHSCEIYKHLIDNFNIDKMEKIKLYKEDNRYIVSDGCHRLAILTYLNNNNIEQYLSYIS